MGYKTKKERKKKKKKVFPPPSIDDLKAPKSFIFRSGPGTPALNILIENMRRMMLPYTAQRLTKKKSNTLKDFHSVAGPLGVTHFIIFSKTDQYLYMRIARLQQGPTLTFNVLSYSNSNDVLHIQKDPPRLSPIIFERPPLVVLNNFVSDNPHIKLASVILQNMFPVINVSTIVLRNSMRVVLFDYDKDTDIIEMRHYLITMVPVGLSKSVKRLMFGKEINLGSHDAVEYVLRNTGSTESDAEDNEDNKVVLPTDVDVQNKKSDTRAIRLKEIGPRITMRLMKIEEGFCEGYVVYHLFEKMTTEEKKEAQKRLMQKKKEKEQRRKEQERNVRRKKEEEEEAEADDEGEPTDAEYYRREVGEEPDPELFSRQKKAQGGKKNEKASFEPWWKTKKNKEGSQKKEKSNETKTTGKRKKNTNDSDSPKKRSKKTK